MTRSSFGTGRYAPGESDAIIGELPTWTAAQPKGVIWCHGSGELADSAFLDWRFQLREIGLHATVHIGDLGGQTWGNDTAVTRIGQAIDHLEANYGVVGPVALVGMSMGGCSALNYAVRFPGRVACVAGLIPLTDLAAARANSYISARWPEIDAIYGAPPNADYTGHNPVDFAPSLPATMPVRIWSSSDDPLVPLAMSQAFVARRPQTVLTDIGALGHNINAAMTPSLVGFLAQHLLT